MEVKINGYRAWSLPDRQGQASGYFLLVASDSHLRRRAYRLGHKVYREEGYHVPYGYELFSEFDYEPETVVFLIVDKLGNDCATMTLNFDTKDYLPSDQDFSDTIQPWRDDGQHLAEVTRLAIREEERNNFGLLSYLIQFSLIYGWYVRPVDACIVEVMPRHAPFYERMFGFEQQGPTSVCQRVKHECVLLRFDDLSSRQDFHNGKVRGFYQPYFDTATEWRIAGFMQQSHSPMSIREVNYYKALEAAYSVDMFDVGTGKAAEL